MDLGLDQKVDTQSVHVKQAIESVHSELDDFHGYHVAAVVSYSTVVPRYSSCQIMHQHMHSVCESAIAGINFQGFDAFKLTLFKFLLGMHVLVAEERPCFPHQSGLVYQENHLTVKDAVVELVKFERLKFFSLFDTTHSLADFQNRAPTLTDSLH